MRLKPLFSKSLLAKIKHNSTSCTVWTGDKLNLNKLQYKTTISFKELLQSVLKAFTG